MNAFVVVAFVSIFGLTHGEHFSYAWSKVREWPGICVTGSQQSPINIVPETTVFDREYTREPLRFRGYSDVHVEGIHNGHTLEWRNAEGYPAPVLSGGPLRHNYTFLQFHIHWDSEHRINNRYYKLEIHMVHIKSGLTFEQALTQADGLAVLAVMGDFGDKPGSENEASLQQIMPDVSKLKHKTETRLPALNMDLGRLFSPEPQSYYTYHGSLTTPPCSEAVTWIVMDQPLDISPRHYKKIQQVDIGEVYYNYRVILPINGRTVYRSVASSSNLASPGLLALVAFTLNGLASKIHYLVNKGKCIVNNVSQKVSTGVWDDCTKILN